MSRAAAWASAPGDHAAMPAAAESVRNRTVEIAAQPKSLFALVGANLHPIAGPEIKGGTLVIAGGKIAAIGPAGTPIPPEAQTIEMSGLDIWPGMVDAGSTIGLFEIGSLAETQDHSRRRPVSARAALEHRPSPRQRAHPGDAGQRHSDVVHQAQRRRDLGPGLPDRLERLGAPRDGDCRFGRARTCTSRPMSRARPMTSARARARTRSVPARPGKAVAAAPTRPRELRKERLEKIKELFRRAIAYDTVVKKAHERGEAPPAPDLRLDALVPYARGEKPVIFHADQPVEILDALDIARELKLKAVISGGSEAWKVADAIKKAGRAGTDRRHPQPAAASPRPLRLGLHQSRQAACRGRDDRHPSRGPGAPAAAKPPRETSRSKRQRPSPSACRRTSR